MAAVAATALALAMVGAGHLAFGFGRRIEADDDRGGRGTKRGVRYPTELPRLSPAAAAVCVCSFWSMVIARGEPDDSATKSLLSFHSFHMCSWRAHGMTAAGWLADTHIKSPFLPLSLPTDSACSCLKCPLFAIVRPSVAHKDSFFTVYHCRSTHLPARPSARPLARSLAHEMARVELVSVGRLKKKKKKERRKWWNL